MQMLKDLLKKKKAEQDGEIDPTYKKAKMGVLKQIHDMASKDLGEGIKGVKKVEVAAPDTQSLKSGLDTAKALLGKKDDEDEEGSPEEEAKESPEEEAAEEASGEDDDADDSDEEGKPSAEKIIEDEIDHEADEHELSPEEIDELIQVLQAKKAKLSK